MIKLLRYLGSGWPTTGFWRTGFSPSPPTTGSHSISHHPHPAAEPVAPFANVSDFPFSILPTLESGLCRLGGCSSYHHYHHPRNSGTVPNLKSFCVFIFKCCKCWAALAQIILTKKCCYHANAGTLRNVRKASSLSCTFLRCTHTWYLSQTPQTASFFVLSSLRYIFLCWNRRGQNTLLLKRPWILLYILEALTDFGRLESKPVHILVSCFYFWLQGGSDPRPRTIPVPGTTNTDNEIIIMLLHSGSNVNWGENADQLVVDSPAQSSDPRLKREARQPRRQCRHHLWTEVSIALVIIQFLWNYFFVQDALKACFMTSRAMSKKKFKLEV